MEPTAAFLLPRPVPTSAGVIYQKPQFPFKQNLSDQPIGCAIIRPSVENTLSLLQYFNGTNNVASGSVIGPVQVKPDGVGWWSFAPAFVGSQGTIPTEVYDYVDGTNYHQGEGSVGQGNIYYSEPSDLAVGTLLNIRATSDSYMGSYNVRVFYIDDTVYPPVKTYDATVLSSIGSTATLSIAAAKTQVKWGIEAQATKYVPGAVISFTVSLGQQLNFGSGANGLAWKTYSLWDILGPSVGNSIVRTQYATAQRTCVTAFSFLLRNTTAALFKSGSIVAGQMTGGTEDQLPRDPEAFYNYVAGLNDPKTYSGQLNKGLHWFFAAEKIQDMFYSAKPLADSRPFAVVSWQGVASGDLGDVLGLAIDFRINIECLTNDISMMKFVPSPDPLNLVELYLTMVSIHNPFSENPGHMKKVANILRKLSQNPLVRETATRMVKAGVQLIPLALASM